MLITPELIAELHAEMKTFRRQVDNLQARLDRFDALFGKPRRKTRGIMRARVPRATGKKKLAG